MSAKALAKWYVESRHYDYKRAKREISERFLGVPIRGKLIKFPKVANDVTANVVGVGVSNKTTGRMPQGVPSVTFYVREKLPKSRLTRRLLLPKTVEGLLCDVVACGKIVPGNGGLPFQKLDPVTPGAQIQVGTSPPGTLGAFVRDSDNELCLISNCHVLSKNLASGVGEQVFQPGRSMVGSRPIATVKTIIPVSPSRKNSVDVALARLNLGVNQDPVIPGIGQVNGTREPEEDEYVVKYGQASQFKTSYLESVETDVVVDYGFMSATFARLLVYSVPDFAQPGDSGSVVVGEADQMVVGLLCAVSDLKNFVIPIREIEKALGPLTWL